TAASVTSTLNRRPTRPRALAKQAAYPAAKSCSGLVPAPLPPSSVGGARVTASLPSELMALPSRPPVAVAIAVYCAGMALPSVVGGLRSGERTGIGSGYPAAGD